MVVDYIIVGQGLAGTVLAHTLIQKNRTVTIINDESLKTASSVAAGIYNPVTGKRLVKTWKADLLFPYLIQFYKQVEMVLDCPLLYPMPIYKPFSSISEQNNLFSNSEFLREIDFNIPVSKYSNYIYNDAGGFGTRDSGYLDVTTFISKSKAYFDQQGWYINANCSLKDVTFSENKVIWRGLTGARIIFCEGTYGMDNDLFRRLPFLPTKGQLLQIDISGFPEDVIFNKNAFIVPVGNGTYKAGATYEWYFSDDHITIEAKELLVSKINDLLKTPYKITGQLAGIRPTVKDRRPLIGTHKEFTSVGIFNGLGTKGVSLAPYLANHFYEFLEQNKYLDKEVNIERFYSL